MGRQRTINDHAFWHSPLLQQCTTEDKVALLHLLTCSVSNIIGAYNLVPRIVAAEIGWTQEQWLQVIERLQAQDLVWFEPTRMFVWVRIWWDHNLASQTMGPKLRARTLENIRQLPEAWLEPFLASYETRLTEDLRLLLNGLLEGEKPEDAVSADHGYGIDAVSNLSLHNSNANSKYNTNLTPTLRAPDPPPVDKSGIPSAYREEVDAAIAKAQRNGTAKADAHTVRAAVAKQFQSNRPPRDAGAYAFVVAQSMATSASSESSWPAPPTEAELAAWSERCFCWPSDNPKHCMRVEKSGYYEQVSLEDEQPRRGYAPLGRSKLLAALREGRLREVPPAVFADMARSARP